MKKISLGLLCLLLLVGCGKKSDIDLDLLDEDVVLIENKTLNKHRYEMDVTLNPKNHTLGGKMNIEIKNNSNDDWQEIYLRDYTALIDERSKPMTYTKVSDGINDLEAIVQDDLTVIKVPLVTPLKAGQSMNLYIEYTAYMMEGARGRFNYGIDEDSKNIRYSLGNFYPVLSYYENGQWVNHPYVESAECFYTPVSDYVVTVRTPQDYEVSATGTMEKEIIVGNEVCRTFKEENVRDFAMSIALDYEVLTSVVDDITVHSYFYAGDKEMGQLALDEGVKAIKLFNRYLGKYPYSEVDIAAVPYLPGGGMEFPGHVMILQRYYQQQSFSTLSKVVVHELAHQWFYGIVGNDQFDMAWLDESMASMLEYVYLHYYDLEGYEKRLKMNEKSFKDPTMDPIITKAYDEYDIIAYINAVYSVGGEFLNQVRIEMGNDDFMQALREYVNTYAYLEAKSENLIEILNKHSQKSLAPLFEEHLEKAYLN